MRKVYNSIPREIFSLFLLTVVSLFLPLEVVTIILLCILVVYIVINICVSQRRYGKYRYLLLFSPFFSKKRVFISMASSINRVLPGKYAVDEPKASKPWVFMSEMKYLLDTLPKGTFCTCCTHERYVEEITKRFPNAEKSKVHKGNLKKEKKLIGLKDSGNKIQFYKISFVI